MEKQIFEMTCNDMFEVKEVIPSIAGRQLIDWGLHAIGAPIAWQKTKGENVKVAVLDTGVDPLHLDLIQNLRAHVDFTNSAHGSTDINGHGTHVCGIIGGNDNEKGIIGVAPECELYSAKVLGDHGGGSFDSIVRGIRWAMAQGVDIINMSLGTANRPPEAVHQAIKDAHAQGIILVAATGNENSEVCYPAAYDEVIAVSAIDERMERAKFSNYGVTNEICAPGVDITSTYSKGRYAKLSGTSMATPIVTGAIALYISNQKKVTNKKPTINEVHQALLNATIDLGAEGRDKFFGEGVISLKKLL